MAEIGKLFVTIRVKVCLPVLWQPTYGNVLFTQPCWVMGRWEMYPRG